ncbi:PREDICTED: calmodulin-binding protein 60 A-like isoform X2 [Ipomoea nil]|uniref:calmodulin-binding protein 60 A-like isoform X2 n=1 Tax=Ipomoea nil TaxID=35883 RepID=UPI00090120F6|nr:PREDICTED: calmodulin-binding protein 60 A-like isoform X2 [Ipomoea nil]
MFIYNNSRHNRAASRSLQLKFSQEMPAVVFTGERIVAKGDGSLEVALVDGATGDVVRHGAGTSGKLEIVPVEGNFDPSFEDFDTKIVVGEDGRTSLLGENPYLEMKEGNAPVYGIKFKHTRKWMRKGKFRLGARFVHQPNGIRIREAVTEPFVVKDQRSKSKKRYPPSPTDEVWRLKNIGKEGAFHKSLVKEKIVTVKDFVVEFRKDRETLRDVLGNMSNAKWEATLDHALTCELNGASCSSINPCVLMEHDKNNDVLSVLSSQPDDLSQDMQRELRIFGSGNELSPTSAADILSDAIASLKALNPSDTDDDSSRLLSKIFKLLSCDDILENSEQNSRVEQRFASPNNLEAELWSDMVNEYMLGNAIHSLTLTDAGPSSSTCHHQMQHNEDLNSDPGNLINGTNNSLRKSFLSRVLVCSEKMAFSVGKSALSQLRLYSQKADDSSLVAPRRGLHIEPGAREKARKDLGLNLGWSINPFILFYSIHFFTVFFFFFFFFGGGFELCLFEY